MNACKLLRCFLALWLTTVLFPPQLRAAMVNVNLNQSRQTIAGMGINPTQNDWGFSIQSGTTWNARANYELANLRVDFARVGLPFTAWNTSLNTYNTSSSGTVHNILTMSRQLQRGDKTNGNPVQLILNVWGTPNFYKVDPSVTHGYDLRADRFPQYGDAIARYIKHARDNYNVNFRYVAVANEADFNGGEAKLSPAKHAELVKAVGQKLVEHGLNDVKIMLGETAGHWNNRNWGTALNYTTQLWNEAVRIGADQYLGPMTIHTYNTTVTLERNQAAFANSIGRQIWATEVGSTTGEWRNDWNETKETWSYGMTYAEHYWRVLYEGQASMMLQWFWMTLRNPIREATNFKVVQSYFEHLRPGTEVVTTTSDTSNVRGLAAKDVDEDRFVMYLINRSNSAQTVNLSGLPASMLTLLRHSATETNRNMGNYLPTNGTLTLTLPAQTFSTLYGALGLPPPPPPPPPLDGEIRYYDLTAFKDAHIRAAMSSGGDLRDTNYGTAEVIQVRNPTGTGAFNTSSANYRKVYIGFERPLLDALEHITDATLSLQMTSADRTVPAGNSVTLQVHLLTDTNLANWGETTITWNNAPANVVNSATAFAADKSILAAEMTWPAGTVLSADSILDIALNEAAIERLNQLDPNAPITLMLSLFTSANADFTFSFHSRETTVEGAMPPMLNLQTLLVPEPGSASLLAVGALLLLRSRRRTG